MISTVTRRPSPAGGCAGRPERLGHALSYDNMVVAEGTGSRLTWSAALTGPFARVVLPLVAPVSAMGQRRRTARLARLAEVIGSP